jgi:N-acyl-D-aspartate/D-glutamate deacylase
MSYDLLIKNGTIVDGTGAPRYRADIAVSDGRIAEIGRIADRAGKVIDASDLIVAPGFVDPHTHYDAQICWDRLTTPSSWHGVTTLIMGNCGVGLAPCRPEARTIAAWDLVNVEAIPFEVLAQGVTWDWVTFPEYMDAAARRSSAVNLGFMAPLTPFRHYVMGEAAMERAATPEETARIKALIKEAVRHGAFGFTTSNASQHIGYQGRPLACRNASREELKTYATALKELGRGAIELVLTNEVSLVDETEHALLDLLLSASGRGVTWLALLHRSDKPDAAMDTLRKMEPLIERGGIPQTSCRPFITQIDLRTPFMFANMACWNPVFNRSPEEQKQVYRDTAFRSAFRKELETPKIFSGNLGSALVHEVGNAGLRYLEGKTVTQVAQECGKDVVDTFLDLAIEDDLQIQYLYEAFNSDESRIPELIKDPRTMIGLSDGGAHVTMICDAGYCTYLLGTWVRDKGAMTLEHAVRRITSEPAAFFGISGRGRIAKGLAADFAIFDPNTVGSKKRGEMQNDLPGGARRLVMPAEGMQYTIVNGTILYEGKQHTGALPGQVLRSGQA